MNTKEMLGGFLGRGQGDEKDGAPAGIQKLPVELVEGDPNQPRKQFDPEALSELAGSLKLHGQLQPIRVRRGAPGRWVVIAGERRLRAAKLAGLTHIEATVVDHRMSDEAIKTEAIVENLLRQDLSQLEQARAYRRLLDAWGCSMSELARRLSVAPSTITRCVKLLEAPAEATAVLEAGGSVPRAMGKPSGRKQKRAPRGAIQLPEGYVVLRRGATVEALVASLQQYLATSRKAA